MNQRYRFSTYQAFDWYTGMDEARATLAYVALGLGRRSQAREHLSRGIQPTAKSKYRDAALLSLPAMALLFLDEGAPERAVELYALASRYPYVANSRWFEDVAGKEIAAAAESLPPDVVARAQERGRARDLWATMEELLEELGGSPAG
jgi:hypothetical protein